MRLGREGATRDRKEEARRRAYEERLRIARDVHDVVGHGLAVINMQAGVALHVLGRRPDQAEVALEAIKTASKDALDELRATLAVFRQPDEADAPRRPTPGLDQLESLTDDGRGRAPRGDGRAGQGLTGMRERAAAVGGTLEAGPRGGGGFRVHARLPSGEDHR